LTIVSDRISGYEATAGNLFGGVVGSVLSRILGAPGVGIPMDSIYSTAVIPWRLSRDRNPRRGEINGRRDSLAAELTTVQPLVIVALGDISAYALFADRPFEQGEWRTWKALGFSAPTFCTLHPREALWNHIDEGRFLADPRTKKRRMWDDWRAIADRYNNVRERGTSPDDGLEENR